MMIALILAGCVAFLASVVAVPEMLDRAAIRKRAQADALKLQERKASKSYRRSERQRRRKEAEAEQARAAAATALTARVQGAPELAAHQVTQRFIPQRDDMVFASEAAKSNADRLTASAVELESLADWVRASLPDWLCNPGLRRSAILCAPWVLGLIVAANLTLDFLIFHAIFPLLVALLVTPLTVVGVALFGSMLLAGLGGHFPASAKKGKRQKATATVADRRPVRLRRLLLGSGMLGTFGLLFILALVAPYRSAPEHQQKVDAAQTVLRTAEGRFDNGKGDGTQAAVQTAQTALNQAQADKDEAAKLDRSFVIAGAAAELALVEFTLLASPLLELSGARRRAADARAVAVLATDHHAEAVRSVKRAEQTFGGDLASYLIDHEVADAQGSAHGGVASALAADAVTRQLFSASAEDVLGAAPAGTGGEVEREDGSGDDFDAAAVAPDQLLDAVDAAAEAATANDPVDAEVPQDGAVDAQAGHEPQGGMPIMDITPAAPSRLDDLDVAS